MWEDGTICALAATSHEVGPKKCQFSQRKFYNATKMIIKEEAQTQEVELNVADDSSQLTLENATKMAKQISKD